MKKFLLPTLLFVLLFAIWEAASTNLPLFSFVMPAPSKIILRLWQGFSRFSHHTMITASEMSVGFFLALCLAAPTAWLLHASQSARYLLQPLFVLLKCVPMFALAPLLVLWFDLSFIAIVVPTAIMVFFPLAMSLYQGLRAAPKEYLDYFRIHGATRRQLFFKLQLPFSAPHFFAGCRIGAAAAGAGAIAGEFAGGQQGLGLMMLESRRATDLETAFAALFCLTFLSFFIFGIVVLCEKIIFRIKPVIALVLLASLCSCRQPNPDIRIVLDWLPNPNHVPLYVGIQEGIFAKNGLDVEIVKVHDPSDPLLYLTSGRADIAVYYARNLVQAQELGLDLIPIATLIAKPLNCLIKRPDMPLDHAIIGYAADGSERNALLHLLPYLGPHQMRNVTFDLTAAFALGRVDAIFNGYWNIEGIQLKAMGIPFEVVSVQELGMPDYEELLFVSFSENPAFVSALSHCLAYCREHPDKAFDAYVKSHPDKGLAALVWEKEAWNKTWPVLSKDGMVNQRALADLAVFLLDEKKRD